jgi:hypothetical protein
LLSGEDQSLLVRGNAFLILDLGLDIVDRVGGLDLKGDGLTRQGLDEAVIISVSNRWHGRGCGEVSCGLTSASKGKKRSASKLT